jgi:hypothetical protein
MFSPTEDKESSQKWHLLPKNMEKLRESGIYVPRNLNRDNVCCIATKQLDCLRLAMLKFRSQEILRAPTISSRYRLDRWDCPGSLRLSQAHNTAHFQKVSGSKLLYRDTPRAQTWAVLGLALLTGALRFAFFQPTFDETHIASYNDDYEPVTLTGLVVDEPDVRDDYINLRFRVESLQRGDVNQPVDGLVLVRAPRYPERFYGDRLIVTGRLEPPPIFEDFSYKETLS